MNVKTDQHLIDEVTSRSISQIYPDADSFKDALASGEQLTFYMGIDPTADYVHLGHSTNYIVLNRLHEMGHKIIVLVGDFTAMIGDPSDKTSMRVQLTKEQVQENLKTFQEQISKLIDFDSTDNPVEFLYNSAWLRDLNFENLIDIASNFTVQQMVERDAFSKRIKDKKPLYIHEFFYPFMQGYDSVAMEVDGEIGGTDQTFNMLAGRTLLKRYKGKNKFVLTTTLLENPETGEKLMSKSLGTGVALSEDPNNMFIKVMQLADAGTIQCFIDCTKVSLEEIADLEAQLKSGLNPRDLKIRLAHEVVTMYHGADAATNAKENWLSVISRKDEVGEAKDLEVAGKTILEAIIVSGVVDSNSKARRLIKEGAIKVDDEKISEETAILSSGSILKVGKKHTFKIV